MPVREESHHLITAPVWGADYGMEGALHQSWARGILAAQSANGCMGFELQLIPRCCMSLPFTSPSHSTLYLSPRNQKKKKEKENEILIKVDCPLCFSIIIKKKDQKAGWIERREQSNLTQLPPWILLMIPHRQSTVIPLWNTLWWTRPLCVS